MQRRTPLRQSASLSRSQRLAQNTRLRRMSARRQAQQRERSRDQRERHGYGDLRPACQVRWDERCHRWADAPHHIKKQSAGGSDSEANTVPACGPCNGAVEDHPAEARRRGWVIRSWETEPGGDAA